MKAIEVPKPNQLNVVLKDEPNIEDGKDIKIKIMQVGICGSDIHIFHGTNPLATYPRIIGHEVTGEVAQVGREVETLSVGDHVVIEPIRSCGKCYACRKDRPNVCTQLSVFGVHEDGGMCEYVVLPENQVHKVNKDLDWDETVLAEPFTIGAQAVWRGNVRKGDTVLIQGCGPIGISVLKLAKLKGAAVMMSDINSERLQFAKLNGADYTINPNEESIEDKVLEITEGEGANVVIDAVCLPTTFELSIQLASVAGTVVTLGFDERSSSISQLPITKKELTIVGSRLQTNQFAKVVSLLNEGKLKSNGLITHKFTIDEAKKAFSLIEESPDSLRKACITF